MYTRRVHLYLRLNLLSLREEGATREIRCANLSEPSCARKRTLRRDLRVSLRQFLTSQWPEIAAGPSASRGEGSMLVPAAPC